MGLGDGCAEGVQARTKDVHNDTRAARKATAVHFHSGKISAMKVEEDRDRENLGNRGSSQSLSHSLSRPHAPSCSSPCASPCSGFRVFAIALILILALAPALAFGYLTGK
jgi:hypothetical protein